MLRRDRLHETEITESLIAAARRASPMRLERVSAVAPSVSSTVAIDLRSILY